MTQKETRESLFSKTDKEKIERNLIDLVNRVGQGSLVRQLGETNNGRIAIDCSIHYLGGQWRESICLSPESAANPWAGPRRVPLTNVNKLVPEENRLDQLEDIRLAYEAFVRLALSKVREEKYFEIRTTLLIQPNPSKDCTRMGLLDANAPTSPSLITFPSFSLRWPEPRDYDRAIWREIAT